MKNNFNEKLDVFMMAISSLFAVAVIIYLFYSILSQISTINEFGTLATLVILSLFLAFIVFETIKWGQIFTKPSPSGGGIFLTQKFKVV